MTQVITLTQQLQQWLAAPYPHHSADISGWMHSPELETHLLSTPTRKSALFKDEYGDYQDDAAIAAQQQQVLQQSIDDCYAALTQQIKQLAGVCCWHDEWPETLQTRIIPDDDDEDSHINSYRVGAVYDNADGGDTSLWQLGNQYLCLQSVKHWGDGDFQFYVIATLTPANA